MPHRAKTKRKKSTAKSDKTEFKVKCTNRSSSNCKHHHRHLAVRVLSAEQLGARTQSKNDGKHKL